MVVLSSFQCHNLEFFWKRFCDYRNYHSVTGKHRSWNLKLIGPCNPVQHGKFHHVVPRSFLRYLYNSSNAQLHNNEASIEPIPSVAAFRSATVIQPADFLQPTSLVPINDFPVFQQTKKEGQDKEIKIALSTINKHLSHIGVRTTAINLLHVKCSAYYILCISSVGLFQSLFKWRLSLWVALSTLPGYIMAVAANPVPSVFASLAIGTFLCSGSANTFNQLIERDRDALMGRTKARTLPSGKVTPDTAMKIGIIGSMAGVGILWLGTNPVTAYLGAFNIGLYALGYTPLKSEPFCYITFYLTSKQIDPSSCSSVSSMISRYPVQRPCRSNRGIDTHNHGMYCCRGKYADSLVITLPYIEILDCEFALCHTLDFSLFLSPQ